MLRRDFIKYLIITSIFCPIYLFAKNNVKYQYIVAVNNSGKYATLSHFFGTHPKEVKDKWIKSLPITAQTTYVDIPRNSFNYAYKDFPDLKELPSFSKDFSFYGTNKFRIYKHYDEQQIERGFK